MIIPFIEIESFDKAGRQTQHIKRRVCNSFNKNLYNAYFAQMACADLTTDNGLSVRDQSNAEISESYVNALTDGYESGVLRAGSGVDTYGIVIGSDDTAEDFGMGASPAAIAAALGVKIAHGNGAGELEYQSMEAPVIAQTGGTPNTWSCEWTRYFNNTHGSSNDVGIKEVGVYINGYNNFSNDPVMIARDVLASTITVVDQGQLKVTYTIELEFPA